MLGDAVAAALPRFRAQAESLMVDAVSIVRPGTPTTDPETGAPVTPKPVVYVGKARFKAATTAAGTDETGTAQIISTPGALHLPIGAYQPEPGDVATCTGCPLDPGQIGRRVRLLARFGGSQVTQYRVSFEEA